MRLLAVGDGLFVGAAALLALVIVVNTILLAPAPSPPDPIGQLTVRTLHLRPVRPAPTVIVAGGHADD